MARQWVKSICTLTHGGGAKEIMREVEHTHDAKRRLDCIM